MARPPKTKEIVDITEIPGYSSPEEALSSLPATTGKVQQTFEDDEYDDDDVTELNKVLDELGAVDGDSGFVTVYREIVSKIGGKREDEYIDRFNVGEFTLADLKERFGAGRYKVSVYRPGGKGLATRKVILIAQTAQPVNHVQHAGNSDISELVKVMSAGFQQLGQLIVQARPAESNRADMLREMSLMKELFAPAVPVQPVNYNPVEMMKLGMEMAQSAAGGDSNNAWVGKAIETFGPLLGEAVLAAKTTPMQQAPIHAALPPVKTQVQTTPTQVSANQSEEEPPMNIILKGYMRMILTAAQNNEPVEDYADSVLNMLPASQLPEIEGILRAEAWFQQVTNLVPQAVHHMEWFTNLRNTIIRFIDEDREASGHDLTGGEVSANVTSHENANTAQPGNNIVNPQGNS